MRIFIPFSFSISLLALVEAQAPSGTSTCDYYASTYNTGNATATVAQQQWITQFVVNVFAGNSTLFSGTSVAGILTASSFNGTAVRLVKYFDGTIYSTDGTTGQPQAVNWLDDDGVVTMSSGRIANSNTTNQYQLFSHFSNLFAHAMGCSAMNLTGFTTALAKTNLYQIHKYMALNPFEVGYFIEQVGLAAQLVGLTPNEADTLTTALGHGVTYRCLPAVALFPGGPPGPQSICTDSSCPLAPNADCSAYDFDNGTSPKPALVNGQVLLPAPSNTSSPNTTSSTNTTSPTPTSNSNHHRTVDIAVGVAVPVGVMILALLGFLFYRQRRKMAALENRMSRWEVQPPNNGLGSVTPQRLMSGTGSANRSHTSSQIMDERASSAYLGQHNITGEHYTPLQSNAGAGTQNNGLGSISPQTQTPGVGYTTHAQPGSPVQMMDERPNPVLLAQHPTQPDLETGTPTNGLGSLTPQSRMSGAGYTTRLHTGSQIIEERISSVHSGQRPNIEEQYAPTQPSLVSRGSRSTSTKLLPLLRQSGGTFRTSGGVAQEME